MVRKYVLVVIAASAAGLAANTASQGSAQRLGSDPAGRSLEFYPATVATPEEYLEASAISIANASRVSIGVERHKDPPLPEGVVLRPTNRVKPIPLTGLTAGEALDRVRSWFDSSTLPGRPSRQCEVEWHGQMAHVSTLKGETTFLDRRIPSFVLEERGIQEAVRILFHQIDSTFPVTGTGGAGSGGDFGGDPNSRGARIMTAMLSKKISVSLGGRTARDVLDALALAHGGVSWVTRYPSSGSDASGSEIVIASFDGAVLTFSLPKRH